MTDLDKEVAELLARAMEQPGVREVMSAYEVQRQSIEAFAEAQAVVSPKWVSTFATSTTPSE